MNPEDIFIDALRAMNSGEYTVEEVNGIIQGSTDFESIDALAEATPNADRIVESETGHPNMFGFRMAIESAQDAQASEEMREIGENPVRSAAGSAAQFGTFGFADEIVGAFNEDMGQRLRSAQTAREEHAPVANMAAGAAGGLIPSMIGGGAAMVAGRAGAGARGLNMFVRGNQARGATASATGGGLRAAAREGLFRRGGVQGFLSGGARGGALGAAGGAATGAGFAEEGGRLEGAARGAGVGGVVGAALGAPVGMIAGLMGSHAGRGARVINQIEESTNNPVTNRVTLRNNLRNAKDQIRKIFYEPLEEVGAAGNVQLTENVANMADDPLVRNLVDPDVLRRVEPFTEGRTMPADASITFTEAQRLRSNLRDTAFDFQNTSVAVRNRARQRAEELDAAMQDAFGEPLRRADGAWNRIGNRERAFEAGIKNFDNRAGEIEDIMQEMTDPIERQAFIRGRLSEIRAELTSRNEEMVPLLKKMLDAGEETRRSMRTMFPEDEAGQAAFDSIENMLRSEASQAAKADFIRRMFQSSAVGLFSGAVAGGIAGRTFGGGGGGGGGN